jgi:hypothetical protein
LRNIPPKNSQFYDWAENSARLVTSWATEEAAVNKFLSAANQRYLLQNGHDENVQKSHEQQNVKRMKFSTANSSDER